MRVVFVVLLAFVLMVPSAARAQSLELSASAGPTITDAGYSLAGGVGVALTSKVSVMGSFERTHLFSQTRRDGNLISNFRGGTFRMFSGEVRVEPRGRDRVGPFVFAGFAAGTSEPNVTDVFPTRVTNDARAFFAGGGLLAPLGGRAAFTIDARMLVGAEGVEGIVAVAPLRAGLMWRF